MAANAAVDALQDELVALTCEEQKPSPFKKLPPSVFIALARRYLDASQRVALAASEKYAQYTAMNAMVAHRHVTAMPPRILVARVLRRAPSWRCFVEILNLTG